jgi:beta-fructofuranosidase
LKISFFFSFRSSLTPDLYKPTFAGFVDTDISSGKISLRSLVLYTKFTHNIILTFSAPEAKTVLTNNCFCFQIDRSVVESFGAGGKTCILSRVYPSMALGKDAHLYVFNNGATDIKVSHLTAWEMKKPLMNGA